MKFNNYITKEENLAVNTLTYAYSRYLEYLSKESQRGKSVRTVQIVPFTQTRKAYPIDWDDEILVSSAHPSGFIGTASLVDYQFTEDLPFEKQDTVNNKFIFTSVVPSNYIGSYRTIADLTEINEHTILPGTEAYIKDTIGLNNYDKLTKKDKEFLIEASSLFNLGSNVDIKGILDSLKEEIR